MEEEEEVDPNTGEVTTKEKEVCTTVVGMGKLQHSFRAFDRRGFKPDLVFMHRVMSEKILGKVEGQPSVADTAPNPNGDMFTKNLQTWLEGEKGEVPFSEAQAILDAERFLLPGEEVTFAIRLWRNTMVLTKKRMIMFQRYGIWGRIMDYTSFPYRSMVAFQTRSAGVIRIGGEIRVWTSTPAWREHRFGISLINGLDKSPGAATALARHLLLTERNGFNPSSSLLEGRGPLAPIHWLFGNYDNMDEAQAEAKIRNDAPLLYEEQIFAAFSVGRDLLVLTTLRVLLVDVQWFSGKSVEYRSIPYSSCRMWRVDFGAVWHRVDIWTDVHREGPLKKVTARFQAATVDAGKIDNFLRDKILLLNRRPTLTVPNSTSAPLNDPQDT